MKPHRATAVLVLGILSLVTCPLLGIAAWIMGNGDLREMSQGQMDPSGKDTTNAGRVCGIIGTVLFVISLIFMVLWFFLVGFTIFTTAVDAQNRLKNSPPAEQPVPVPGHEQAH